MAFSFTQTDIDSISKILGVEAVDYQGAWSWNLNDAITQQKLAFTIHNNVHLGKEKLGSLISVQTLHGYFEIHDCCNYLIFEPDEVIFVQANKESVSCMIVGKGCTCSMYSNIDRNILHSDFSDLDAPVLLSAMQLSLTEAVLD
jgi:hypothetical protein